MTQSFFLLNSQKNRKCLSYRVTLMAKKKKKRLQKGPIKLSQLICYPFCFVFYHVFIEIHTLLSVPLCIIRIISHPAILQSSDWCFLVTPCRYSMEKNIMMHNCSCCQEEKFSQRQVMLKCANSSEILHNYIYVESCRCTPTKCEE